MGGEPVTDQPALLAAASIDQLMPVPLGRRSETDRPVAPTLPTFESVTVKPTCEPYVTLEASAVFVMVTTGLPCVVQPGNLKLPMRVRQLKLLVVE